MDETYLSRCPIDVDMEEAETRLDALTDEQVLAAFSEAYQADASFIFGEQNEEAAVRRARKSALRALELVYDGDWLDFDGRNWRIGVGTDDNQSEYDLVGYADALGVTRQAATEPVAPCVVVLESPEFLTDILTIGTVNVFHLDTFPASTLADDDEVRLALDSGYEDAIRTAMVAVPAFEKPGADLLARFAERVIDLGIVR